MGYKDEELLRLRQKAEEFNKQRVSEDTLAEELKESIHDPVTHITKIPVVFEERDLLDGRIVMRAPRDLSQLTDDAVRQQFLMESKPQFVYELPYLPFGLTFMLPEISKSVCFFVGWQDNDWMYYLPFQIEKAVPANHGRNDGNTEYSKESCGGGDRR